MMRCKCLLARILLICILFHISCDTAFAESAGSTPSSLAASATKVYVELSSSTLFFTGSTYADGVTVSPAAGTICQLYSEDWFTGTDGLEYYSIYYQNTRYNVLRSDVADDIMTATELEDYITNTYWKLTAFDTLRVTMGLVGDIRVHAVQLALQKLGYYTGKLDGSYGSETAAAVKRFQSAQGLSRDGSVGPLTAPVLFALASGSSTVASSTVSSSTVPEVGSLTTNVSVNLRKGSSTGTARLSVVPQGVTLNYTSTVTKSGIIWYQVTYNSVTGWLMGTFVSSKANASSPAIGTVTITKAGTRVRDAANGNKTGTVLAKGTVVDLLAQPVSAGGYTWYNIRTGSGLIGFVRGDCSTASIGTSTTSSSSGLVVSTDKTFVELTANTTLFLTESKPSSGGITVSAGTVLMMYSASTYTVDGTEYCSVYYNNEKYNAVYSDLYLGILTSDEAAEYMETLIASSLSFSLKYTSGLVGDVRVYTLQSALQTLGYYTGTLDGTYGTSTRTAVRNFQRAADITVDGDCGTQTWTALRSKLTGGSGVTVTDFGTVTSVVKASWDYDDNGAELFPKGTYATVMDVETGKVFEVYRWSGANHADCVPASTSDTQTMCEIVGFPYNSNHPTSSQLALIKADGDSDTVTYTWPDFKNAFGGATNIGSAWDRRAALLNVDGTVYPISIYGFPHGYNGTDAFSSSKFPSGQYFYAANNYYGMMCIHFSGSKTHGSTTIDSKHTANIETAYSYAKSKWPSLCN